MAVSANVGGWIADTLVTKGYSVTLVRKLMQTVSHTSQKNVHYKPVLHVRNDRKNLQHRN